MSVWFERFGDFCVYHGAWTLLIWTGIVCIAIVLLFGLYCLGSFLYSCWNQYLHNKISEEVKCQVENCLYDKGMCLRIRGDEK